MNQEYFENFSNYIGKVQGPLKELAELNVKTLQGLNFLRPDDITKIKNPEELVEKNIELFVANGHKVLDYMKDSFSIYEKAFISLTQDVKKTVKTAVKTKL